VSFVLGPRPEFDAGVAITVGVLLGAMALFLAALNRRLLIDSSDPALDRLAAAFLVQHGVSAAVSSIVVDDGHSVVFVHVRRGDENIPNGFDSRAIGEALQQHAQGHGRTTIDEVYWKGL